MAVDLNTEFKRWSIANDLTSDSGDETDTTDTTDETPEEAPKETAAPEEPAPAAASKVQTFADDIAASTPAQPSTPAGPAPFAPMPWGGTPINIPSEPIPIQTDPDTGGRYVIDPDTGKMVPHAELATAEDKAAQPTGGREIQGIEVTGKDYYAPEEGLPMPPEVRRAQLVKLPPSQPSPEMGLPIPSDEVRRAQLVGAPPPKAQLVPPTSAQAVTEEGLPVTPTPPKVEQGQLVSVPTGTAPKALPVQAPATQQAPVQAAQPVPAQPVPGKVQTFADDLSPKSAAAQQPPGQVTAEPQIDIQSQSYTKGRTQEPTRLILHSTDGSSEKADVDTLTGAEPGHRVSVNYYVTKDGRVMHFVSEGDTAWHAGADRYGDNGNAYTLGIEQQHVDGKEPWPDAQVRATAGVAAGILARHPNMTIDDVIGHSDLAGERKQDPVDYPWAKFRQYVAEAQGQPAAAKEAAAPSAQPVTKQKTGFYQGEDPNSFLSGRVTTFATPDDIATGQDNGVGAPKLGQLDTTRVAGVAIPEPVLQQMFGRDWAAAARQARVDVVDSSTGKRLRVPIVDLGPSTDAISDMTPALANYFGGDKNLSIKIVPKAGPDVTKNPQLFADEQAAIKNGFDSSTLDAKRQVIGPQFATRAQTTEEAAQAQKTVQAAVQKQQDTLNSLQSKSTNMPDWYHTLENPIPGVTDSVRNSVRDEYKKQVTAYAQDYYKEPDPDKAFARIMSAPNLLTSAGEIWTKAGANFQHAWLSLAQQADSPSQTKLIDFINSVQPNASPEARTALINEVMSKTAGKERTDFVNHLYNDAQAHDPDSVKNVNMYSLLDSIDVSAQPGMQAKEAANHARVAASVAQNIKDLRTDPTMENTYGGVISNAIAQMPKNVLEAITPVIGQSAMFSEIYTDTLAGLRKDYPDWSEDQVKAKAAVASMPQDMLQELVNLATVGMGSGVTRGITNPLARIATNAILHGTIAGTAATTQQAVANVATGRPVTEGLLQAGATGLIQGAIGGAVSGRHPAEAERVSEPVTERPVETPAPPAPAPPRPVTAAEVTGPEVADQTPWSKPGPIVTRAEQPETFSPSQLAEGVAGMRAGGTPEEMRQAAENLQPQADFRNRGVYLGDVGQVEIDQAMAAQARQNLYPIDQNGNPKVSEAEPWVSQIANRFTAERMGTGELGAVEPGVGVTKEEMLARGLQMPPETIAQHVSNVMNDVGGNPRDQAAAIRTEEARLSQRSHNASLLSEADPTNQQLRIDADNAFKDLTDFHNGPVAKLKNDWHAQGMTLQGEIPVDLSSYNGLRDAYLRDVGKAPPPEMEPVMRSAAKRVRDAADAESAAMRNLGAEIERQSARRRLPSDEEVRNNIIARMKVEPCPT